MRTIPVLLAVWALALAGCGDDDTLTVSAASSLKTALTGYGDRFEHAKARFSFAGSDGLPGELYEAGLVEKPVTFAGNRLVLAVPASSAAGIGSLKDVARAGMSLAIGSESVPVGSYTRTVLSKLPEAESSAILKNVRSEEPDVAGIVGKLTQGAVDAGFVYVSDVRATGGRLKAIELPDALQPTVAYGVAVVEGAKNEDAARAFVDGLLDGDGRKALDAAGFEPPPAQ
jgi:molybdate transport system substrate-binding protein